MTCNISLGMNVSICLISSILAVLFSLSFRLLLDTNHEAENCSKEAVASPTESIRNQILIDFRAMRICPNFEYEYIVKSIYYSNYDKNCTFSKSPRRNDSNQKVAANNHVVRAASTLKENGSEIMARLLNEGRENSKVNQVKKSISIAGHILAVMLIGSAVAALVEVLRVRLFKIKDEPTDVHVSSRKCSLADWTQKQQSRKEKMLTQRSFEIQGIHRSPLRLLGARPPPLIRRSSFPAQRIMLKDGSASACIVGHSSATRLARKPSVDSDDETNVTIADFRHRVRLIRRH